MGEVIKLSFNTRLDINAADMLRNIAEDGPENAFVIVWPKDGSMPTYHSSTGDLPVVLMRVNGFLHKFYNGDFDAT